MLRVNIFIPLIFLTTSVTNNSRVCTSLPLPEEIPILEADADVMIPNTFVRGITYTDLQNIHKLLAKMEQVTILMIIISRILHNNI